MIQRKITYIIFILLSFNYVFGQSASNDTTRIDASLLKTTGKIELKGKCDFYWHQLLNPGNYETVKDSSKLVRLLLTDNWTNYSLNGKSLPAFGYGSYHIVVENTHLNQAVFIQMKTILTSYKLWINDTLLGSVGKVGTQKLECTAKIKPTIYEYFPKKDETELNIIIQVSNYTTSRAGILENPILFKLNQLDNISSQKLWDAIVFGILMIIAVYFLIIYLLNNRDKASLWLAIFALILGIRSGMINSRFLPEILPFHTSFSFQLRLEYFSAYSNIALVALFFHHLFDQIFRKPAIKIIVGLGIIFSLFILLAPVYLVTTLRDLYNLYLVLSGLYIIFFPLLRAVIKGIPDAIPAFTGIFIMLFTAILDVLTVIFQLPIPQLAPWGLVIYLIFQAYVVSHRFSAAFNENIDLSSKLAYQNENLEQIVEERTDELKYRNEELQAAEEELRQNNEELNVLNENISRQKERLEASNKLLIGQATLFKILQKDTDHDFTLKEFLQFTLDEILKLPWLNVLKKGAIFKVDSDGNLEMLADKNIGVLTTRCKIIKPNECLCGKTLASKQIIFENKVSHNHEIKPDGMQAHGHYNLPLLIENKVMGVLNIYVEEGHEKGKEEVEFLQILSDILASIIHRTEIEKKIENQNKKLFNQNKELTNLKENIELKEEQLRRIIENQGEGFALINTNFNIIYVNSAATKILKIDNKSIINKNISEFWSSEERSKIKDKIASLKGDESLSFETYLKTKHNEKIIIQSTISINRGKKDEKIGYIVNFRDITKLKKAEQEIKAANLALKKYFIAIESSPLSIVITNTKANIEYINPTFTRITGYELSDFNITPKILNSGKTPKETYKSLWKTISSGKIWEGEFINKKKSGEEFLERALIAPIKDSNNKIINYVAIKEDITEKRKTELKITKQHKELTRALRNINDSITYAKKLQKALLSPLKLEQIFGKNISLLFLPRDVVSGDFYYASKKKNWITFAVGDCTGHGVPGAFLSVLSYSILDDIIHVQKEIDTALTLEIMRIRFKQVFSNGAKDGLDIALCAINIDTQTLYYSGAYNPLILLRDGKLIEKKASYNPIGHYAKETEFKNHEIKLQEKDKIYLFSDGFIDQFGGDKKRKFMRQKFYAVLEELNDIPIENQSNILHDIFDKWKGELEQVDDVSVMGIEWSEEIVK